ncbi:alginate export family protein [Novosphingobium lentum]|uniref:alginate export family protein n=1 Tax=Novosphingobium lentum TaxID=145287 RepID=UPI00082BD4F5|nr:alginate export family protein [Novosphingobium lentum]
MTVRLAVAALVAAPIALASVPACAAPPPKHQFGDPVPMGDGLTFDPMLDLRLRYEHVDQPATDADAVTLRLRSGFEIKHAPSHLAFLAEAEATLAFDKHYNAFPFAIADSQRRLAYSVVADPQNIELNRLQLQYKTKEATVTVGRQRINLDDQRWVGSVGWRQNEQTFDAVRGEAKFGPVSVDATYSIAQRTIFGHDAGPRRSYQGDFVFLGAGAQVGPIQLKGFAYLLGYDAKEQAGALAIVNADTQTYGGRATGQFALSKQVKLAVAASYARQSGYRNNPLSYGANYVAGEAGLSYAGFTVTGGYELLGSNKGRALQTQLATLHKFNGWADVFLTTPAAGLQDLYGGVSYKFAKIKALPGLNAGVTYHRFDSDVGHLRYGDEWDASFGLKVSKVTLLAKYARYNQMGAKDFATDTDTKKFWLQAEYSF